MSLRHQDVGLKVVMRLWRKGKENEVVAMLNTVKLSSPEFPTRRALSHIAHTHRGEKPFTINDSFTAANRVRFVRIAGKNIPFIYINDNSKVLAERIVLYVSCILHSLLCKRASAKQVEFAVSKLLCRADFFSCHQMDWWSSKSIPPEFVFHKMSLSSLIRLLLGSLF